MSYDYELAPQIVLSADGVERMTRDKHLHNPYSLAEFLREDYGYSEVFYTETGRPIIRITNFHPQNDKFKHDIMNVAKRVQELAPYAVDESHVILDEFYHEVNVDFKNGVGTIQRVN